MVPPPANPIHAGVSKSWTDVQKNLAIRLPKCLDEFSRSYGSGCFDGGAGRLFIYNPYDPGYKTQIKLDCDVYVGLREDSPEYYPYDCFPEPGGLFPTAYGDGGGIQFYVMMNANDPEDYLIVFDNRSTGYVEYPGMKIFQFFHDFLCNKILRHPYFPTDIKFTPQPLYVPDVVKRIVALPMRVGGERRKGLLSFSDIELPPAPVRDVVVDIEIRRENAGYLVIYSARGGAPNGESWYETLAEAEQAVSESFGVDPSRWETT